MRREPTHESGLCHPCTVLRVPFYLQLLFDSFRLVRILDYCVCSVLLCAGIQAPCLLLPAYCRRPEPIGAVCEVAVQVRRQSRDQPIARGHFLVFVSTDNVMMGDDRTRTKRAFQVYHYTLKWTEVSDVPALLPERLSTVQEQSPAPAFGSDPPEAVTR